MFPFPAPAASSPRAPAPIGIMSALHEELAAVLALMPDEACRRTAGRDFWVGHWHGCPVVAVLSRVGKVAAATTATALIEHFGVRAIVLTGVAGGVGDGVRVGDVVVADSFVQHDMDARPLFPRFEVPLYGQTRFAADAALSARLAAAVHHTLAHPAQMLQPRSRERFALHDMALHTGLIASGDQFIATTAASQQLRRALDGVLAVEMEGAAIAQVCHDYQLPFAAMRTISDRADDAAHVDFPAFVQEVASHYSSAVLEQFFRCIARDEYGQGAG